MSYEITILNADGTYPTLPINGVTVAGPAIAVSGVSFIPIGGQIDAVPSFSFRVPLTENRNNAIVLGVRIDMRDIDIATVVAQGYVTKRDITGDANGEYAVITCADLMDELRRATVTTGFATGVGESFQTTGARLVSLADTTWGFFSSIGTGFDGVAFTATGSVAQAVAKFATERHAHFKRSPSAPGSATRALNFDVFGAASGLTLTQASPDATEARRLNPYVRQITSGTFQVSEDGNIVNCLTPAGGGTGFSQVTLGPVYNTVGETLVDAARGIYQSGPMSFAGADNAWPIYRRANQNGGGASNFGMDYFLMDLASIALYGRWWGQWSQTQISVSTVGTATSAADAAASLYTAAVAHMHWNSTPRVQYQIQTDGHGDLRDIAGKTVRVRYRGIAEERIGFGQVARHISVNVDTDLVVMSVQIAEDDKGDQQATWTVSNLGVYAASDTSIVISALEQVQYGNFTAQTYPAFPTISFEDNLDSGNILSRAFPGNGGTVRLLEAKITVYVLATRSPVQPLVHGHAQPAIAHDVNMLNHDVNAIPHDVAALNNWHFQTGGTDHGTGGVNYNPTPVLNISTDPPSGAVPVMFDGKFFYATKHGSVPVPSDTLQIYQSNPTTGGTGGTVKATTGASTGTGQVGGIVPATKGGTAGKTLASATAIDQVGMQWGMYLNPAPLPPVTIKVGATTVGTVTGTGSLDATAAVLANGAGLTDFTVTASCAGIGGNATGLCRVSVFVALRTVVSSLAKINTL